MYTYEEVDWEVDEEGDKEKENNKNVLISYQLS